MISDVDVFFRLKIEGEDVSDVVRRLELDESDSLADLATFTLGDDNLVLLDVLHEGLSVEIDLGRPDEHAIVFRGVVTGITADVLSRHGPYVEVTAGDSLIALSLRPRTKRWWNTPVSGIVREVAVSNGLLPGRIEPDGDLVLADTAPEQQVEETDLAFLNRLARRFDSKVFVDHTGPTDSLNFVSTRRLLEAGLVDEHLVFNGNLAAFRAGFDASATAGETRVVSTDAKTGETVELSERLVVPTEAAWAPDTARIVRLGPGAERVAALLLRSAPKRARLTDFWRVPPRVTGVPGRAASDRSLTLGDRARRLGQRARGLASGTIVLRPRARVQIDGVGGRWSGPWYLARVRHIVDTGRRDYRTAFVCTR
jgi:Phage tail baseplate hub (GPD)